MLEAESKKRLINWIHLPVADMDIPRNNTLDGLNKIWGISGRLIDEKIYKNGNIVEILGERDSFGLIKQLTPTEEEEN